MKSFNEGQPSKLLREQLTEATLTAQPSSNQTKSTAQIFEPPQFDEVDLTEEEAREALRYARQQKHYKLARAAYEEEMRKPMEVKKYTPEELFDLFKQAVTYNGKSFVLDSAENKKYVDIVKRLCCYFTGDERFRGDLKKGLLLMGNVGCGKTALLRAFMHNQVFSYRVVNMIEIAMDYRENGDTAMRQYKSHSQGARDQFGHAHFGLALDDVGLEEIPVKHYGGAINVFAEVLQLRSFTVLPFTTHISTNKTLAEMQELYGTRVYDRMKEMFNVISFEGIPSFRQ